MTSTSTVSILVCDLVGSTARHARLGEDAADGFRSSFFSAMRGAVEHNHGEVVKNLGDGLLVVFRHSAVAAVACAHDLHRAMTDLVPDDPVQLRIGVSAGEAAEEDGDWFGMPVIEASRLCAVAAPTQTITTGVVRTLVGSRGAHHFTLVGPKNLKGIPVPVEVWTVTDGSTSGEQAPSGVPITTARRPKTLAMAVGAIVLLALIAALVAISTRSGDASTPPAATPVTTSERPSTATTTGAPTTNATSATPSTAVTGTTSTSVAADGATIVPPTDYTPVLVDRDCATDPDASAAPGVECWTLTVPENRANPERTIELHGYRIPAATDPDNAPTVIDLGPTTSFAYPLSEVANIVMIPSRGFGLSTPAFGCPEVSAVREAALVLPSNDPAVADQLLDALRTCRGRLVVEGFSLASYNFEAEISDVADYLIAAGIDEVFMTGLSQDAPAVLVAADRFPGTIRGVFLQNPVDPGSAWQADPAKDLAASFGRYAALCTADPVCGASFPDLSGDYRALYDELTQSPRLVEDVPNSSQHSRIYPTGTSRTFDVLIDGERYTQALYIALRVKISYATLAVGISDQADAYLPGTALLAVVRSLSRDAAGDAALLSYQCAAINPLGAGIGPPSAAALPAFGAVYDASLPELCEIWDVPDLSKEFISASNGATPTFIAVGELAPVPATFWAENLRRNRRNTTVISFPTLATNLEYWGPRCYQDLLQQFVLDPMAELDVEACAAESPPIEFVTSPA